MTDSFANARPFYDVTFPSSGDGFSIAGVKNAFQGLGFADLIPLQPRAHSPSDNKILVRGRDASSFYNPIYYGDQDQRISFSSGDSPAFATPADNPRIDVVYVTPSGDIRIQQGSEAASPSLPSIGVSGDRMPVCAVWNRPTQTNIVNFEDKDSNTGDGYIYQDLRPWLTLPGVASGGGGDLKFVSTTTISDDATIDITGIAAGYDYIITIEDAVPATDNQVLFMRTSANNGVSFDAGVSDYAWSNLAATTDDADSELQITSAGVGNAANESATFTFIVHNPGAAINTVIVWHGLFRDLNAVSQSILGGGQRLSAAAVDAVQLLFASGNMTSGTVTVWRRIRS